MWCLRRLSHLPLATKVGSVRAGIWIMLSDAQVHPSNLPSACETVEQTLLGLLVSGGGKSWLTEGIWGSWGEAWMCPDFKGESGFRRHLYLQCPWWKTCKHIFSINLITQSFGWIMYSYFIFCCNSKKFFLNFILNYMYLNSVSQFSRSSKLGTLT